MSQVNSDSSISSPYYLLLTFWGDQFRDFVCNLTFPSLLAPGNIPALGGRSNARFLIATTAYDWEKLQHEPIFQTLRDRIEVEFLPNEESVPPIHKYVRMSRGHAMLADRCFRDKAIAININPDSVYPDGCIAEAQRLSERGKHVILCVAVRFEMEGVEKELAARGMLQRGQPFSLSMREATVIGLRNLHPETRASGWIEVNFGRLSSEHHRLHFLTCCYWEVPGEDGCIIITHNWSPFLVNYAILGHHDTTALDGRALDGNYIFENFPRYTNSIEVIQDSDSIFLLGLTPHDEMMPAVDRRWWRSAPVIGECTRGYILNQTIFDPGVDEYRRRTYRMPVRFHGRDFGPAWNPVERKVEGLLHEYAAVDLLGPGEKTLSRWHRLWFRVLRPLMWLDAWKSGDSWVRPTVSLDRRNSAVAALSGMIPVEADLARRTNGASFTGTHFVPSNAKSVMHVRVTVTASAAEPNDLVLAVFREQDVSPVHIEVCPIPPGGRVTLDTTFKVLAKGAKPIELDCRIGPGRPGTILFNGPAEGPPPNPATGVQMWEGSRWLAQVFNVSRKISHPLRNFYQKLKQ